MLRILLALSALFVMIPSTGLTAETIVPPAGLQDWQVINGQWRREAKVIQGKGNLDNRLVLGRPAPPEFTWPVTMELKEGWSAGAIVWAGEDGQNGYTVRLDNRHSKLVLEEIGPWPEVSELAAFPLKPGDGTKLSLRIVAGGNSIRVYWPERSEYPVLEARNLKPAGDRIGFQVIDGHGAFVADVFWPVEVKPVTAHVPKPGKYCHIYNPSVGETGDWYINDHCFVQDSGGWHLFGITGPKPANAWAELNFAHAVSSDLPGTTQTWQKKPYALTTDRQVGEAHLWAPHVIKRGDTWHMFYCAGSQEGDSHYRIHLATSTDLTSWTRHSVNPVFKDTFHARDPMVLEDSGLYYMYYTANSDRGPSHHTVHLRTSRDLIEWSPAMIAFEHPMVGTGAGPTESPFVVKYGSHFYLFIGPDGPDYGRDYRRMAVYRSSNPLYWEAEKRVTVIPSHAAEVLRDEDGQWFVSDSGWDIDGVYLAPLKWEPEQQGR